MCTTQTGRRWTPEFRAATNHNFDPQWTIDLLTRADNRARNDTQTGRERND